MKVLLLALFFLIKKYLLKLIEIVLLVFIFLLIALFVLSYFALPLIFGYFVFTYFDEGGIVPVCALLQVLWLPFAFITLSDLLSFIKRRIDNFVKTWEESKKEAADYIRG